MSCLRFRTWPAVRVYPAPARMRWLYQGSVPVQAVSRPSSPSSVLSVCAAWSEPWPRHPLSSSLSGKDTCCSTQTAHKGELLTFNSVVKLCLSCFHVCEALLFCFLEKFYTNKVCYYYYYFYYSSSQMRLLWTTVLINQNYPLTVRCTALRSLACFDLTGNENVSFDNAVFVSELWAQSLNPTPLEFCSCSSDWSVSFSVMHSYPQNRSLLLVCMDTHSAISLAMLMALWC